MDLEDVGKAITEKKVGDRRDRSSHAAGGVAGRRWPTLARLALKHIPAERLMFSSDCGMGREGMSRRHAFYKMVALVQGVNIVQEGTGPAGHRVAGRRSEVLADSNRRSSCRWGRIAVWQAR